MEYMNFKEAVVKMMEGKKVAKNYWKFGLWMELREDGFYNQDGIQMLDIPTIGKWKVVEDDDLN